MQIDELLAKLHLQYTYWEKNWLLTCKHKILHKNLGPYPIGQWLTDSKGSRDSQASTLATWTALFIYIICQLLWVFKFSAPTLSLPYFRPLAWARNSPFLFQLSKWTDQNMHNKVINTTEIISRRNLSIPKEKSKFVLSICYYVRKKKITWVSHRKFLVTTRASQNPILRIKLPFLEVIRTAEETFFFLRQKQYCGVKWSIKKQNS